MSEQFYLYQSGDTAVTPLSTILRKFTVSPQKIVREHQLADGSLKRDLVATKRTWKFSWEWMPSKTTDTADGGLGVDDLEALYNLTGVLVLRVPDANGSYATHNTLPSPDGFEKTEMLRQSDGTQYWSVSLSLRET